MRSASTSEPDLPITMPGRAVWMLTSTSVAFLRIVMSDRPACASLLIDVLADVDVLEQEVRELALVEPVGLPVVDVAHAHGLGMNFLTHAASPPASAGS